MHAVKTQEPARLAYFAIGAIDRRSVVAAAMGFVVFAALAVLSLELSRFGGALAKIWLPNAVAVAFLLRARLNNEILLLAAIFVSGFVGNFSPEFPIHQPLVFAAANIVDIASIVFLVRLGCGLRPDMTNLEHLAKIVLIGGLVGPFLSSLVAVLAMVPNMAAMMDTVQTWFLTDSLGMVLIVPTALLLHDAIRDFQRPTKSQLVERSVMLVLGCACVFLVFYQPSYPLLFLIPPITLLHAFRLGSTGTALFVALLAFVAMAMSWSGYGPIAAAGISPQMQAHLLQAFVAANFLTGLPVAVILAGRERMMEELEQGKRELALLADNTTDALMCFDLEGRCTYASPSVASVMGETPENFIGKRPSDRTHEDSRELIFEAQERLISGESTNERFTYRRFTDSDDGLPVFIEAECAVAYSPETGEREGIVVSARNVTERVELELLLTRARRKAERAARAKSEFLANMSHEIRTPMNGVLGFAELTLQNELDPQQRRNVDLIVQSGRSMMLLLNDILDFSKIEAGQISIDKQALDLDATLEECAALHRPSAEKKGLELHFESDAGEPWVTTDGLRVRQIVLNLIANAVKFTEVGRITVSYRIEGEQIIVEVLDTGIGISPKRLSSIFQPFTQGESNTARRFGGTGLGLSISRQLAELLGGTLDVESEPGRGSCFTLTLPFSKAQPLPEIEPAFDPAKPEHLPRGTRILLAEDHDVNRLLVTEMLEQCGQDVSIAHDGNEAIAMVLDAFLRGAPYDLVLMDVQMPGCDGYAATRAIRGEGIGGDILPIIALTANAFPEDITAAREAGMQAHLAKPLELTKLAQALQRWLPTQIVEESTPADYEEPIAPRRQSNEGTLRGTHAPTQESQIIDFPAAPSSAPSSHSPALLERWEVRREEALEALRSGLTTGGFDAQRKEEVMQLLHKLAGTAAMFGEAELGDRAAMLEQALRGEFDPDVQLNLARDVLNLADARDQTSKRSSRSSG